MLNLLCLCFTNGRAMPGRQHMYLQHGFLNILSPLLRPTLGGKKDIFQNLTAH